MAATSLLAVKMRCSTRRSSPSRAFLGWGERCAKTALPQSTCSRTSLACHFSDGGKVDSILDDPYNGGKRIGIDAVIVNAMAESHISEQSVLDPLHPLRAAEKIKQGRHKEQCEARGMKYLTLLATTFGAVSGDFWKVLMKPYFKKARAAAKRDDTKDFWDVIRKEQRLLDLLSVIIARANADIIRNLPARGRYAPSSPSEPPSASSSPQYEVDDDDDDRKENYSPQWEASSPGYD